MTAFLLVIGVAGIVDVVTGKSGAGSSGGIVFVFLIALFTGSGARAVAKGGRRAATAAFGAGTPESGASGPGLPASAAGDRRPPGAFPAADPQARYRERCSQFPVTGAAAGFGLLAASVAGLIVIGGPNGRGAGPAGGILVTAFIASAGFLVLILIDLPNGIEIANGHFAVGVRGVPPAGRLWRRITGPLDAVRGWDVLSAEQVRDLHRPRRAARRSARGSGRQRQYLGDLRMFSRRQFLRLEVDPAAVQARLPSRILAGYTFVDAARAGAIWDGAILIGTRHSAALTAALQQALPGRRDGLPAP